MFERCRVVDIYFIWFRFKITVSGTLRIDLMRMMNDEVYDDDDDEGEDDDD